MQFPSTMDAKTQGLIIALALRFAKNKPGLERDDLINEALVKYETVKTYYDPEDPSRATFTTVLYGALFRHFLNMQTHFKRAVTATVEESYNEPFCNELQFNIDECFTKLRADLIEPISKLMFEKLIETTPEKKTVKQLCEELDISFFRYQQAEHKIRNAIGKLNREGVL